MTLLTSDLELYTFEHSLKLVHNVVFLCKTNAFMLHFYSQVINIVCSVNTSLINNDLFHLVSVYC